MIHTIFQQLLDTLLPPPEPVRQCRALTTGNLDTLYAPTIRSGTVALLPIAEPSVRALIHANKFYRDSHACYLLGYTLSLYLQPLLLQHPVTLLPIPLGATRERERGHNQVMSILTALPNILAPDHISIANSLLRRTRETPMQSHLNRTDRLKNVADCFAFNQKDAPLETPLHLILIDDVVTTGATLGAAAQALRPHLPPSATLSLLALAY